jgi:hypothetical protein
MLFVLRRRQRSDLSAEAQRAKAEAIHASASGEWIASSLQRKIAFAILSRAPLRKRVAFVAGNDAENACLGFEAVIPGRSAGQNPE